MDINIMEHRGAWGFLGVGRCTGLVVASCPEHRCVVLRTTILYLLPILANSWFFFFPGRLPRKVLASFVARHAGVVFASTNPSWPLMGMCDCSLASLPKEVCTYISVQDS